MSGPPDPPESAGRWLRFAREDLHSAQTLLDNDDAPRLVCWAAQQAAEKAVKAALVYAGIRFPKSHDIDRLLRMVPGDWNLSPDVADAAWLSDWALESRYPGDWPDADTVDAQRAIAEASKMLRAVERDLQGRGVGGAAQPEES